MALSRVIISGGGTGGHIFPAIAIANAIKKRDPAVEILFVGANGRMEMEKVPQAGYKIEGLWISGLQRRLTVKNLMFPLKVISSLWRAGNIIRKFKPDVAIGVGGYASGPLLRMATAKKIPAVIQEQNSFPGITNKILAGKASRICVAYPGMEKWFPASKIVLTGNPVRYKKSDFLNKKEEARHYFQLDQDKPVVLVIGGSLGARTINESIKNSFPDLVNAGLQLIWQTGKLYTEEAGQTVKTQGNGKQQTMAFIDRMDLAYSAADVIVSRAGALSIAELCLVGKPVILVPSPNVAEDHQTKNAMALVEKNAALLVTDKLARESLVPAVIELAFNKDIQNELSDSISKMALENADDKIADEIFNLVSH